MEAADDPLMRDPWVKPTDPLRDVAARAEAISREIPLVSVATGWDVTATRAALAELGTGVFERSAQLCDSILGDSRVQSGLASRVGGLLGRPVSFRLPDKMGDSSAARECRDAFVGAWSTIGAEPILGEIDRWGVVLGFGPAQLLWDTSRSIAVPHIYPWHPRYTYFHWMARRFVAITMDRQEVIEPGDGHWLLHAPHGAYRGWMYGAVRAIAPWWLARNYALRDWARYSERHGLPIIKAKSPSRGDPVHQNAWRASLATIGQETVLHLPQDVQPGASYDVDLLEAKDTAHEGFRMLIQACDTEITLALLAQNLTTEVREGSYAAARVHADVRQALLEADARALELTIYTQIARPFAAFNFGDADLAPRVVWDVTPYEDAKTSADTLKVFASSLAQLRAAGFELDIDGARRVAADLGIRLPGLRMVDPLQAPATALTLAPTDLAKVVRVDEARSSQGLPPIGDERGKMTIGQLAQPPQTDPVAAPAQPKPDND